MIQYFIIIIKLNYLKALLFMKKIRLLALLFSIILFSNSCSKIVLNNISDALSISDGNSVFTSDDDPEFMAAALPLALKLYEAILAKNPKHIALHTATAKAFCSYSYAFIQFPADTLSDSDIDLKKQQQKRAKKMYLRARGYGLDGLELKYPGFKKAINKNTDSLLAVMTKEDAEALYWTGLSWMAAFIVDKFDMKLALSSPKAKKILFRVAELDPEFGDGAIDEFLISFYGAMPKSMGGDIEKAKKHYERALLINDRNSAGPYIAYATSISIPSQNLEEFRNLMKKAYKIKPEANKANLLLRTIQHEKAAWYLRNEDNFFLIEE